MCTQHVCRILLISPTTDRVSFKLTDFVFLTVAACSRGIQGVWIYNGFGYAAHLGKKKGGSGCLGCREERGQPIVLIGIASISPSLALCFCLCLRGWIDLIGPGGEIQTSVPPRLPPPLLPLPLSARQCLPECLLSYLPLLPP